MEDEEHVIFYCPEYNICRLKYPKLFNLTENSLNVFFDDQETIFFISYLNGFVAWSSPRNLKI